jgi:hypothetical protein
VPRTLVRLGLLLAFSRACALLGLAIFGVLVELASKVLL